MIDLQRPSRPIRTMLNSESLLLQHNGDALHVGLLERCTCAETLGT